MTKIQLPNTDLRCNKLADPHPRKLLVNDLPVLIPISNCWFSIHYNIFLYISKMKSNQVLLTYYEIEGVLRRAHGKNDMVTEFIQKHCFKSRKIGAQNSGNSIAYDKIVFEIIPDANFDRLLQDK